MLGTSVGPSLELDINNGEGSQAELLTEFLSTDRNASLMSGTTATEESIEIQHHLA